MGSSPSLLACVAQPPQARESVAKARRRIGEGGQRLRASFRETIGHTVVATDRIGQGGRRLRDSFRGKVNVFNQRCNSLRRYRRERRHREKLKSQSWQVATEICPTSDLKPSESCQSSMNIRFTQKEWSSLAFSLYPEFIGVSTICRDYLGVCPPPKERRKTQRLNLAPLDAESLSCPTCLIALAATASFMADRNVEGEMVDFLAQNFCKHELHLTDCQYCPQYVKEIIPKAMHSFAPSTMAEQVNYCRELFHLC